jgi:hypothetical protein
MSPCHTESGRIIGLFPGLVRYESGGIVRRAAHLDAAAGLRLAPLEIFPERHPQPLGARAIALPATGWTALLTRLAVAHALPIKRAFGAGKPKPGRLDIGALIGYSLPSSAMLP